MHITSSSIESGRIRKEHACRAKGGTDQTPQLSVEDIPFEGKYVSIVADDPDAVRPAGKVWVHWNVFNVPVTGRLILDAGQPPSGEVGATSGQGRGYEGPCPPDGEHTYRFAAFATTDKVKIDTSEPWTIDAFEVKYGSLVVGKALLTGRFGP
ncbi:MAG: YbhB/YbcL family Raf kinase inhibitor-like protein [Ramlibacter sp.]